VVLLFSHRAVNPETCSAALSSGRPFHLQLIQVRMPVVSRLWEYVGSKAEHFFSYQTGLDSAWWRRLPRESLSGVWTC